MKTKDVLYVVSATLLFVLMAGCSSGTYVIRYWDAQDAEDMQEDYIADNGLPDVGIDEGDQGADVFEDEVDVAEEDAGSDAPDLADAEECDSSAWYTYEATGTPVSIPDNNPGGITSWIDVTGCAMEVWDLQVQVNIQHRQIGDLLVELLSPDGRKVILHNRTGGVVANIVTTYPTSTDPYQSLCNASRQLSTGRWGLFVSDNAASNSGELESWSLRLTGAIGACPTDRWYSYDSFPLDVPDNNPTGISSTIDVAESGSITSIRVGVDIRHPYIGDLRVSIRSPDGTQRLLHDRTGGMSADIRTFYPTPTSPAEDISIYLGTERSGTWTLNVSDNAAGNAGVLEGWVLEID
jgi:subtilisin-like proprotein convertase family protein